MISVKIATVVYFQMILTWHMTSYAWGISVILTILTAQTGNII